MSIRLDLPSHDGTLVPNFMLSLQRTHLVEGRVQRQVDYMQRGVVPLAELQKNGLQNGRFYCEMARIYSTF